MNILKKIVAVGVAVVLGAGGMVCAQEDEFQFEEQVRVARLNDLEIMTGDSDGKFHPYRVLTRAELAKIAVLMSNPSFEMVEDTAVFPDVDKEHWAYEYIQYAGENGILSGHDDGKFCPDDEATVQEFIKTMVTILGYSFQAEQTGGYPSGYIMSGMRLGITGRISAKTDSGITRIEAAEMAALSLDVPLMVESGDGEYVICDGSSPEYPEMTLAKKNYMP